MKEHIENAKFILRDLKADKYNEILIKSLEECIKRLEDMYK